ncbi:MarR family transcriptional regulator [Lactiplantibacillus paraplantarum]|nr:MarR family transcriptional regulator [Lactiplantibacillus paraplantarum]
MECENMTDIEATIALFHQVVRGEEVLVREKMANHVPTQQLMVLTYIAAHPGIIQRNIVELIGRKAATVSVMLKNMEQQGLIIRQIPSDNSRNKNIFVTDDGQKLAETFKATRQRVHQEMLANLSADERQQLQQLVAKVKIPS